MHLNSDGSFSNSFTLALFGKQLKLAISNKVVRQKANSSKSFSKKLLELAFSN